MKESQREDLLGIHLRVGRVFTKIVLRGRPFQPVYFRPVFEDDDRLRPGQHHFPRRNLPGNVYVSEFQAEVTATFEDLSVLSERISDLPLVAIVVAGQLATITCPTSRWYIENRRSAFLGPLMPAPQP